MFRAKVVRHQGVQLYETIANACYHLQYTELW